MWSAARAHRTGRRPTVPPPRKYVLEISAPIIGDLWRFRTLTNGEPDGDYDEERYPTYELCEVMGSRITVYYRAFRVADEGWHLLNRCDVWGRPIKGGWAALSGW
jgi:hypothetical protein